jgi:tRNA-splicing ligase RtcB
MNNVFGKHDENTLTQFNDVASRAVKAALMADGHVGYIMPIGGVAAYDNQVSVVGVGFDIACGNCAIKTDVKLSDYGKSPDKLRFMLAVIANKIRDTISFGIGRSNKADDAPTDHPLFQKDDWFRIKERAGNGEMRRLYEKAQQQLGTVGSGNHYVDVFVDETDTLWVGVHFGSRGLGHGIATGFLNISQGHDWFDKATEAEVLLSLWSSMGQDYWALMNLAGEYAYAGREWVARKVVEILKGHEVEMVHNHHNFAWKETHENKDLIVVRKGATPAFPGQKGFVGGSMGDVSVILKGTDHAQEVWDTLDDGYDSAVDSVHANMSAQRQQDALYSTVHGAGRVMSRSEAKGKVNRKTGQLKLDGNGNPVRAGKVTPEMMKEWVKKENVIVRGGGVDEAPHVYRRLPEVLKAQGDTIRVLHTLKPLIVVMAGDDVRDPYKD